LSPATVTGDAIGTSQLFRIDALDGSGQPVPNLPITLGVFGANTQQLTATTDSTGIARVGYAGATPGTDTVTATAFISGLQPASTGAPVLWSIPQPAPPPPTTSGNGPPGVSNLQPADGTSVARATPVTATITAAAGTSIASWSVTDQLLPSGALETLASGTGA